MKRDSAELIAPDTYWIGAEDSYNHLHCNTYLIVDGGECLLIDPGPVMTFPTVEERVRSIIPIEDLSCIVLLHQDPDVAGATPRFEKAGFSGMIAATRRTSVIAAYYDIASPFYLVEEHEFRVTFRSGKEIEFLPAPYLHFPGAIMAYDPATRFLFSGDLFGAFTEDWNLFADETYIESMEEFHREYMPGNDILRPVMEVLIGRDIAAICPQHGSIIDRDIARHITVLPDLQCGLYIDRVRRSLGENRDTSFLINMVLEKLIAAFGKSEVVQCLTGSRVEIHEETGEAGPIEGPFEEVWNGFFNRIYACGGHRWLAVVEPLIDKLSSEFAIRRPDVFYSALIREKQKSSQLSEEKKYLEAVNASLRTNLDLAMEEMTRDQLTGLYNESFLVKYLLNIFNENDWKSFTAYFVHIDHMRQLNQTIGEQKGNELIAGIGSLLQSHKREEDYLFRIGGPVFVLISPPEENWEATENRAEKLRTIAVGERGFLEHITISVGIVPVEFGRLSQLPVPAAMESIFSMGKMMLRTAARNGGNRVETRLEEDGEAANFGRVVIVEYDNFHAKLIGDALETISIDYRIRMNGPEALSTITEFHPDVIVSELFLLETDAFSLKEELDMNSKTSGIPFILVSHQKNESTIARALDLGIVHYIRKPYMLTELLGILNTYVLKAMKHV
ncbi:MAG: diguanylate cyclase [Spirochaetota bacterium]|nr:diguanylate cyclase [Spirochaetota bacterium]